jgi:hypothetical protein
LSSTSNATKGLIKFGTSAYDEVNNRLGIGNQAPTETVDITGTLKVSSTTVLSTLTANRGVGTNNTNQIVSMNAPLSIYLTTGFALTNANSDYIVLSLTLPAGTWLVLAQVSWSPATTSAEILSAFITGSVSGVSSSSGHITLDSNVDPYHFSFSGLATCASTQTVSLVCTNYSQGNSIVQSVNFAAAKDHATGLIAIQIAP